MVFEELCLAFRQLRARHANWRLSRRIERELRLLRTHHQQTDKLKHAAQWSSPERLKLVQELDRLAGRIVQRQQLLESYYQGDDILLAKLSGP